MSDGRSQGPASALAEFAGPIKWIGIGIAGFAVFILLAGSAAMLLSDEGYDFGILVVTGIILAIGLGIRYAGARLAGGDGPEMPVVAGWTFMAAGGAMVIGGIVLVFEEPGGFALIAFGAIFIAVGWFAKRLFATPEGKKAVFVQHHEAAIRTRDGRSGTRSGGAVIHVDEDADEAEIEAARADWLEARFADRADWVTGRIEAQDQRNGGFIYIAAAIWIVIVLATSGAAAIWDEELWFIAGILALVALVFVGLSVRTWLHRRKYTASHCVLDTMPLALGEPFSAEVESGIAKATPPGDGFEVSLSCVHRWEESRGVGSERRTRQRRDVLWREDARVAGTVSDRHPTMLVPVAFTPPGDQQEATLGGGDGIYWELSVRAAMPGIDYEARFELPVLASPGAA